MRFFMYLPLLNEKAQSVPLPAEVFFFMQNQAIPTYHYVLKLGFGLGGILNILCIPAISESVLAEPIDAETNDLGLIEDSHLQTVEATTGADTIEPHPEALAAQVNVTERRLILSKSAFIREPQLSKLNVETTARALDSRWSSNRANNLAFERRVVQPPLEAPPLTKSEIESHTETNSNAKPKPWSINRLTTSGEHSSVQTLSVSDIQHIGLTWGKPQGNDVNNWITDLIQAPVPEETPSSEAAMPKALNSETLEATDLTITDLEVTNLEVTNLDSDRLEAPNLATTDLEAPNLEAPNLATTDLEVASEELPASEESQLTSLSSDESNSENAAGESTENGSAENKLTEEDSAEDESTMDNDSPDFLSEILADQGVVTQVYPVLDEELGTLRMLQLRSRQNEELGILRILRTAQAAPPKPTPPIVFLGGRLGFVDVDNVIRNNARVEEQIYQAGASLFLVPKISPSTSLYAIAETNVARYNNIADINYNEIQLQIGLRQRLRPRTFAQIGWRNQRLYSPGYREKLFAVNYIDAQVSHRSVLSSKVWLDSFYQMRLGFAEPRTASRFRQTMTLSLNYGVTRNLRTSLLYQLDLDDYTQIPRYDTYQQVLGIVSYNLTPESRISVFGGTRFGNSSEARVNLDDTFYGAGLNVSVPLF